MSNNTPNLPNGLSQEEYNRIVRYLSTGTAAATSSPSPSASDAKRTPNPQPPTDPYPPLKFLNTNNYGTFSRGQKVRIKDSPETRDPSTLYGMWASGETLYDEMMQVASGSPNKFKYEDIRYRGQVLRRFYSEDVTQEECVSSVHLEFNGTIFSLGSLEDRPPVLISRAYPLIFPLYNNIWASGDISSLTSRTTRMMRYDGVTVQTWYNSYTKDYGYTGKHVYNCDEALAVQAAISNNKRWSGEVTRFLIDGYTLFFEYIDPQLDLVVPSDRQKIHLFAVRRNRTGDVIMAVRDSIGNSLKDLCIDNVPISHHLTAGTLASLPPDLPGYMGEVIQFPTGLIAKVDTEWYAKETWQI